MCFVSPRKHDVRGIPASFVLVFKIVVAFCFRLSYDQISINVYCLRTKHCVATYINVMSLSAIIYFEICSRRRANHHRCRIGSFNCNELNGPLEAENWILERERGRTQLGFSQDFSRFVVIYRAESLQYSRPKEYSIVPLFP